MDSDENAAETVETLVFAWGNAEDSEENAEEPEESWAYSFVSAEFSFVNDEDSDVNAKHSFVNGEHSFVNAEETSECSAFSKETFLKPHENPLFLVLSAETILSFGNDRVRKACGPAG